MHSFIVSEMSQILGKPDPCAKRNVLENGLRREEDFSLIRDFRNSEFAWN